MPKQKNVQDDLMALFDSMLNSDPEEEMKKKDAESELLDQLDFALDDDLVKEADAPSMKEDKPEPAQVKQKDPGPIEETSQDLGNESPSIDKPDVSSQRIETEEPDTGLFDEILQEIEARENQSQPDIKAESLTEQEFEDLVGTQPDEPGQQSLTQKEDVEYYMDDVTDWADAQAKQEERKQAAFANASPGTAQASDEFTTLDSEVSQLLEQAKHGDTQGPSEQLGDMAIKLDAEINKGGGPQVAQKISLLDKIVDAFMPDALGEGKNLSVPDEKNDKNGVFRKPRNMGQQELGGPSEEDMKYEQEQENIIKSDSEYAKKDPKLFDKDIAKQPKQNGLEKLKGKLSEFKDNVKKGHQQRVDKFKVFKQTAKECIQKYKSPNFGLKSSLKGVLGGAKSVDHGVEALNSTPKTLQLGGKQNQTKSLRELAQKDQPTVEQQPENKSKVRNK